MTKKVTRDSRPRPIKAKLKEKDREEIEKVLQHNIDTLGDGSDQPKPPAADHPIEPVLTAEQQEEVARLAHSIAETEKPPAGNLAVLPAAPEPLPAGSYQDDATTCVGMFVEFSVMYCADVAPLWPDEKQKKVAAAVARVFEKYNFSFARFGPEIALIMVAGPVLWQTSKVIALQMNNQAPPVPEQARAPVPHGEAAPAP
jgi:hypothetical protein